MTILSLLEQEHALARLKQAMDGTAAQGRFALAYSGGLDSRFLAHAAVLFGFTPLLLHVTGPHVPLEESAFACAWAGKNRLEYREVPVDPLHLPLVATGDRRRCYACKREIFTRLLAESPLPLNDGTNASDASAYRPGIQAVRELGVHSPLALAGLGKKEIHALAAATGMEDPEQKARPCLLTRLPYGTAPTRELLAAIATGERVARSVLERDGQPELDLRLRLVAPGRLELHMLRNDAQLLSPALREQLSQSLTAALPGWEVPGLAAQDSLSGFFDKN